MDNFSRKVEETVRNVEAKIHEAAPELEREAQEMIAYLNNEVVPAIRSNSTKALRVASEKLVQLADYIERQKRS